MSAVLVPVKTPEAVEELGSRQRKLSQRHRTVLLLVDGQRLEGQVRKMALQAGAPEACYDELVSLGLIALVPRRSVARAVPSEVVDPVEAQVVPLDATHEASNPVNDSMLSLLPASQTLAPESSLLDLPSGAMEWESQFVESTPLSGSDLGFVEARALLSQALRSESPVAGSLTLMRLKRARSREALAKLLPEVEARITKPTRALWAAQTMQRAREMLSSHDGVSLPPL